MKIDKPNLTLHHKPNGLSDRFAMIMCKFLRWIADTFFRKRYGHRAVVLETVAAVPGMVGGLLIHLKCLRKQCPDNGWIKTLLDEAENERIHLMTFLEIAKPNWLERMVILLAQGIFFNAFFVLYLISPKTAHRLIGYFEEEAIISYTSYLEEIDNGRIINTPATNTAIEYWKLPSNATLRDVVVAVRNDEAEHRDVNHEFADLLTKQ
ncbi:alternative oxidase [endosymbiont of Acanthamoeba sp. UWC8]|uniref:alternative oxidase n=1 Tax=endosymbiont of Acanthamoeba sp. UWC8 TaxID=86106 RepID=UPI0004D0F34C|nr:alternative oxidase [endosymbiont of Acanthamoeba sp. UWC8]AIF81068.1 alternative oxidase [endosymbiont of Acanthamoeba sp. UWC8]